MPWLNITNEQAALLRRVLDQFPQTAGNPRIRQDTERSYDDRQDFQAPEVYIALATGGIAALTRDGAELGAGDTPGSAVCNVYQLIGDSLVAISGLSRTVYNLSETAISAGWITVLRDKFGKWLAVSRDPECESDTGTGNCISSICGVLLSDLDVAGPETGTPDDPDYVLGLRDGCIVLIPVSACPPTTGT